MSDTQTVEKPAETQNAEPKTVVDGNGSGNPHSMLPGYTAGLSKEQKEELVSSKAYEKLPKEFKEFWAQHTQLEANAQKAVAIPSKDASAEEWKTYRSKMGIPDTAEGYAFDKPQLPEGMTYDPSLEKWFKEAAFNLGITSDAAKNLFKQFNDFQVKTWSADVEKAKAELAKRQEATQEAVAAAKTKLQAEWGENFSSRLAGADTVFKADTIVAPDLRQKIIAAGLHNDPGFVRMMDIISRATKADSRLGINVEDGEATNKSGFDYGPSFRNRYKR